MEKFSKTFGIDKSPIRISYFGNRLQFYCQTYTKQFTINVSLDEPVPVTYGQFFIQPDFLFTLSKSLKFKDEIVLEKTSGQYYFKNGISLAVQEPQFKDNPKYAEDSSDTQCIARCTHWKTVLKQCLTAVTEEKSRFKLDVVRLHCGDDGIKGIATDGRRMVVSDFQNTDVIQGSSEVSIHENTVNILLSSILDQTPVDLDIREKSIVFMYQRDDVDLFYQLESNLAEDNFPKWQKILPETKNELVLSKTELLESLSKMSKFAHDPSNMCIFDFSKKRTVMVTVPTGNGKDELKSKIKVLSGGFDTSVYRFNYNFVLDILHDCNSETVVLHQADTQIIFSDQECQYHCLLMRMKSPEEVEQERKASANPQAQVEQQTPAKAA
jgi:DNA polymerase III sliding clamp (beta) subunit (PCNA family)